MMPQERARFARAARSGHIPSGRKTFDNNQPNIYERVHEHIRVNARHYHRAVDFAHLVARMRVSRIQRWWRRTQRSPIRRIKVKIMKRKNRSYDEYILICSVITWLLFILVQSINHQFFWLYLTLLPLAVFVAVYVLVKNRPTGFDENHTLFGLTVFDR